MLSTRQYLKGLDKPQLKKLFELTKLNDLESWVVRYAFIERRMVENICMRLHIGKTKYHTTLNEALIKIEFKIQEFDKIRTF